MTRFYYLRKTLRNNFYLDLVCISVGSGLVAVGLFYAFVFGLSKLGLL